MDTLHVPQTGKGGRTAPAVNFLHTPLVPPVLWASNPTMIFTASASAATKPAGQVLNIRNLGEGQLSWTLAGTQPRLSFTRTSVVARARPAQDKILTATC